MVYRTGHAPMTRGSLGTETMLGDPEGPVAHIENFLIFCFLLTSFTGTSRLESLIQQVLTNLFDAHT
ncbi:MAG: hypothetical protein CNE88_04190 [Acidimicrobiales bacterium MED-G01]|nr:MAG: hypothetical protein CNE88_04190 [Acidimicrobiales bacterium MED-G01]